MPSTLPKPSGPSHVGCTDVVTSFGEERSLFRLFYPTKSAPEILTPWVPHPEYVNRLIKLADTFFFSWAIRWMLSDRFVPVTMNASFDVPSGSEKLPVVVFSHGLGLNRMVYSNVCMELASHGMVVASVEHADQSACATYYLEKPTNDGDKPVKKWIDLLPVKNNAPNEHEIRNKQVHKRAEECSKVLDYFKDLSDGALHGVDDEIDLTQFKDKLDIDKCVIVGHSFGGGTSVAALSKDNRYKVAVGLDPWMYPLDKNVYKHVSPVPILLINADSYQWAKAIAGMRKLDADTLNTDAERKMVTLKGAVHMSQSDMMMFFGWNFFTKRFDTFGKRDPVELSKLSNKLMMSFIGKHLGMQCGQELEQLPEEDRNGFMFGSNIEVDEEELKLSKEEIRSM